MHVDARIQGESGFAVRNGKLIGGCGYLTAVSIFPRWLRWRFESIAVINALEVNVEIMPVLVFYFRSDIKPLRGRLVG